MRDFINVKMQNSINNPINDKTQYSIKDLGDNLNNLDQCTEILTELILNDECPNEMFKKLSDQLDSLCYCVRGSMLNLFIVNDDCDFLQKLYDSGIQMHLYNKVVKNILFVTSIKCWDLMLKNGFDFRYDQYDETYFLTGMREHDGHHLFEYLLNLYSDNNNFILFMLTCAIQAQNKKIISFILDKFNQYQIIPTDLNNSLYKLFESYPFLFDEKMHDTLEKYGFVLDERINDVALSMIDENFIDTLKFLVNKGVNLNDIVTKTY